LGKINKRIYPSKLLLFGEHVTVNGGQALAMPLALYQGQWTFSNDQNHASSPYLKELLTYLDTLQNSNQLLVDYDLSGFRQMLAEGLAFDSNIPIGFGLGSSGALSAAIYDSFCLTKAINDLEVLKKHLAQIESYFHGSSSGTDPLVSFLQQGVYIESKTEIRTVPIPASGHQDGGLFLLNTQLPRRTGPLVKIYLDKCKDETYANRVVTEIAVHNEDAIHAFLNSDWPDLFNLMHQISLFQYRYFEEMIPNDFRQMWLDGLASDHFKLKLCGAGGGGFILGICQDFTKVEKELEGWELVKVFSF